MGAEWQVPIEVGVAERLLVGWRCLPEPVDAGPPPTVAALLVRALQKHATLTFPSALRAVGGAPLTKRWRLGRDFVWRTIDKTSVSVDEAVEGIFHGAFFDWSLQGQVVFLGAPGLPLVLDERYLELPSDPGLFADLKSAGAQGALLPGVDGAVAALYFFDTRSAETVRRALEEAAEQAGGRCVAATGGEVAAQLRG